MSSRNVGMCRSSRVRRLSMHILRLDTLMGIGLGALHSEEAMRNGVATETADLIFASLPYRILHEFQIPLMTRCARSMPNSMPGWKRQGSGLTGAQMDRDCF